MSRLRAAWTAVELGIAVCNSHIKPWTFPDFEHRAALAEQGEHGSLCCLQLCESTTVFSTGEGDAVVDLLFLLTHVL